MTCLITINLTDQLLNRMTTYNDFNDDLHHELLFRFFSLNLDWNPPKNLERKCGKEALKKMRNEKK